MRALGRCGVLYRPHSLGPHRILYRTLHANRRLGPALPGPASSCSAEAPCILRRNGNTPVAVTTAHRRNFSASGWQNGKRAKAPKPPHYKWASSVVSDDVYDVYSALESHILDSGRFESERFPVTSATPDSGAKKGAKKGVPRTRDPHNPENQSPPSPDPDDLEPRSTYDALVIDCEMTSSPAASYCAASCGRRAPVTDWRRGITGFNKPMMMEAVKKGKTLPGWEKVRERIFDVTTSETIFIGHALANDLRVLRIATDRVVDSMMMMSRAVYGDEGKPLRNWGLKAACQELLDVAVQKTRGPHRPIEDVFGTRELVLHCVRNPEKLAEWGARTRAGIAAAAEKERMIQEQKMEKRKRKKAEKENRTPEERAELAAKRAKVMEEKRLARTEKEEAKYQLKLLKRARKRERRAISKERKELELARKKERRELAKQKEAQKLAGQEEEQEKS
ncbi:hypothetical protein EKO27_g1577 [Xylaria grammica]|uniref:Exonuclease domain-containing protein n=1 Tax=Xylaria grammica TaxID=363999 RepID=A0A439DGH5_9PEZI|nr:hypothetical protein EKO27_g1577 [Xylaria grammica]